MIDQVDAACDFILAELRGRPWFGRQDPQDGPAKNAFLKGELGGHLASIGSAEENRHVRSGTLYLLNTI